VTAEKVPTHLKIAVSAADAGELLGMSGETVRRLVKKGVIARIPHLDRLLIARVELDRFANQPAATSLRRVS